MLARNQPKRKIIMADWEEIKRLAADFQRAQLSSTAHKLSERNCIEIVQKLIGLGLVEVIYTTDGKEYLTPQQIEREIKDELFVHGGEYQCHFDFDHRFGTNQSAVFTFAF